MRRCAQCRRSVAHWRELTVGLMGARLRLLAVRSQIASALDLLIHVGRLRDGTRRVLEITEVTGYEEGEICLSPIFRFRELGQGKEKRVDGALERQKLEAEGLAL